MKRQTVDRRVARSRQAMQEALLALIRERGFEGLTVQDILDRANVGRATFYAHFDGKEDLLESRLDEFAAALVDHQRRSRSANRAGLPQFAFSRALFEHAGAHRDVFRAMLGKRGGAIIQRRLHRMLLELTRDELGAAGLGDATPQTEAMAHYLAGGLFGLLSWWADGKNKLSATEVEATFRRLAVPAVKAAQR